VHLCKHREKNDEDERNKGKRKIIKKLMHYSNSATAISCSKTLQTTSLDDGISHLQQQL